MRKVKHAFVELGYFTVKDEQSGKILPYKRNPAQIKIWNACKDFLDDGQPIRLLIIKGRQMGSSTEIDEWGLDLSLMNKNFSFYIQAHTDEDAKKLFRKNVKNVFERLPEKVKNCYKIKQDNVKELLIEGIIDSNGNLQKFNSEIKAGVSARSDQIDLLHASELGEIGKSQLKFDEFVDGTLQAAEQGHIILESTAKGKNAFYDFYLSIKDNPKWKILFICWTDKKAYQEEPPENDDWMQEYKIIAQDYDLCLNPMFKHSLTKPQFYWYYLKAKQQKARIKQEYPLTIEEAFSSSSNSFFNKRLIAEREKLLIEANFKPVEIINDIKIYQPPIAGKAYFCGVDTAGEGSDNYSMHIIDSRGNEVCHLAGTFKSDDDDGSEEKSSTTNFENKLWDALLMYKPFLALELNNGGANIQRWLISKGFPTSKIWRDTSIKHLKESPNLKLGWHTNKTSREVLLTDLLTRFDDGLLQICSLETLSELDTFVKIDGKWQAEAGKKDDRVISLGLAVQAFFFALQKK